MCVDGRAGDAACRRTPKARSATFIPAFAWKRERFAFVWSSLGVVPLKCNKSYTFERFASFANRSREPFAGSRTVREPFANRSRTVRENEGEPLAGSHDFSPTVRENEGEPFADLFGSPGR